MHRTTETADNTETETDMKHTLKVIALLLGTCALAAAVMPSPAAMQVPADVNNPTAVAFTPSTDHALVDSYEVDILRPDGTVLQTLNVGKPVPDATNTVTATVNVQPIAFANGYSMRVRARAGTAASDPALSLNKFNRVPGAPSKVTAK